MIILLVLALTGIIFGGLEWLGDGVYWITTGGEKVKEYSDIKSDSLQRGSKPELRHAMDSLWQKVAFENPQAMGFYYSFPNTMNNEATIDIAVYPTAGQIYNKRSYSFDQYSLRQIVQNDVYSLPYKKAGFGQKLRKMNYDIHIGSILGLPDKILAFFASLIGASLPITGFLIWWGKRNKKTSKAR